MKKAILTLAIALVAILRLTAETETIDGVEWTYTVNYDGEAEIYSRMYYSAIPYNTTGDVVVPSILGGCPVTSIGSYAFSGCGNITSVVIPDGVTSIGYRAFKDCNSITNVAIPSCMTSIGGYAFYGCNSLHSVAIPGNVASIGDYAFYDCSALTNVIIGNGVKSIGSYGFFACSNLTSVTIPQSVERIGNHAFRLCSGLTNVDMPDDITAISAYAFGACSNLTNFTIPSSVTNIEENAFSGCSGLTEVTIPDSVRRIGYSVFSGCVGLTSVTIPDTVTEIGSYAFNNCSNLLSITIPKNLIGIYGYTFNNCSKLTGTLTIPDSVTYIGNYAFYGCKGLGGTLTIPDSVTKIGERAFANMGGFETVTIPLGGIYAFEGTAITNVIIADGVTSIGNKAFADRRGLKSVLIPDSVKEIGEAAFRNCKGLTGQLIIPAGATTIGNYAFEYCSGFVGPLVIPEGVKTIGSYAFRDCVGITSVTIPPSVTSIGTWAFTGCNSLKEFHISDLKAWLDVSFRSYSGLDNGYGSANPSSMAHNLYLNGELLTSLVIPDGTTAIGRCAFYGCTNIMSVTIPNSVTNIGESAFSGCENISEVHISDIAAWSAMVLSNYGANPLANGANLYVDGDPVSDVILPDGLTNVGGYQFCGCSNLTSVVIPNGVTNVGASAFSHCYGLKSVTIPSSVKVLGNWAFYECNGLEEVHISDLSAWCETYFVSGAFSNPLAWGKGNLFLNGKLITELAIPDGMTSIGHMGFAYSSIKSVTIPNSVTNIEANAFYYCKDLTSITLSDGLISIQGGAFAYCSSLESVTIPDSVTDIENSAFSGCSNMVSVVIGNGVEYIPAGMFYGCTNLMSLTICGSVTNIGDSAFYNCYNLTELHLSDMAAWLDMPIGEYNYYSDKDPLSNNRGHALYCNDDLILELKIPIGITTIRSHAFYSCTNITSVAIPESVTNIGGSAFSGCCGLTSVTIPNSVTNIGGSAFSECSGLTSVTIGDSVTSIGRSAFSGCNGLTNVTIPNGVTNIVEYAFYNCSGLTSVTIPPSIKRVGGNAFDRCYGLKEVHISDLAAWCSISFWSEYGSNPLYYAHNLYLNGELISDLTIPNGVTSIGNYAFSGCSGLTSVTIPDSVTNLGYYAFNDCRGLTSVSTPNSVTNIGNYAFSGCSGLTSVTIPDSVTSLGQYAFYNCSGLTNVTIPDSVTSVGYGVFSGCSGLTSVTIPDSVTSVGYGVFSGCSGLTSVTIPDSVTSIGNYAFSGCSGLTSVTIPDSVTSLGQYAFSGCSSLTSVTLEGGVFSGYESLFDNKSISRVYYSLEHAEDWGEIFGAYPDIEEFIPIELLNNEVFEEIVDGRTWRYYIVDDGAIVCACGFSPAVSPVDDEPLVIPGVLGGKPVVEIGFAAFVGLAELTGVTIPGTVTNIADYAFYECSGLREMDIPSSVESIGNYAFTYCGGLTRVSFESPSSLNNIGASAFRGCYNMEEFELPETVTKTGKNALQFTLPKSLSGYIEGELKPGAVYVVANNVTVASGKTLTIPRGTILKFLPDRSLTVNGTLDSQGTRAAPVVFTSINDDEHGGDTNGDGDKTYAQAGDWATINVYGTLKFNYTSILYGGNNGSSTSDMFLLNGGNVTFDNSILAHAYQYAVGLESGSWNMSNSIFVDFYTAFRHFASCACVNSVFYDFTYLSNNGGQSFKNCIISRYATGLCWWTDNCIYKNCVIWNPSGFGPQSSDKTGSNGNIWGDPLFSDPDNGDFRIAANSPCVDAGDGTVAPETDYYGQPRMDVKAVANTGKVNSDGVCPDIGIYEVPGTAFVPLPDLAVVAVAINCDPPVSAGDTITLTYVVTNAGAAAVSGMVRDLIRFKGADTTNGGITIDAGEIEQSYNITSGASVEMTANVTVPVLKAGKWKVSVGINVDNHPYEQNLSNNNTQSEDAITVELDAMGIGYHSIIIKKGESVGYLLSGLPVSGGVVRVTGLTGALVAYGGNGSVPMSGCAYSCTTVPLADGSLIVVFPARTDGENAYLVLENGGDTAVSVAVEVKEPEINIYGVEPARVANTGDATVTLTGSGLGAGTVISLGGRTAKSIEVLNAAQVVATFDVDGMAAGRVALVATNSDATSGDATSASLPDAVEIYAAKVGPKLKAWLEMPSSVRDGRVFTGYVCYANEGDSPMTMPCFKVASEDSSTKMGLVASEALTETELHIGGISPTHPAGVLKPGDEARIPFYFQPFGSYTIKLSHVSDEDDGSGYPEFGGVDEYLAAMSAAATRLNLRGRAEYDIMEFFDQVRWERNGVPCAAASGYLYDAKTGEPLAKAEISLVPADSESEVSAVTGTTDEGGYFQLGNLADGEYRWLLDRDVFLADASANRVSISGQVDINGLSVFGATGGRISGRVISSVDGVPVPGASIKIGGDNSLSRTAETDDFGYYCVSGLFDSTYSIAVGSRGCCVGSVETNVVISAVERDAVVDFALALGGVVSGVVKFDGSPVTNGVVRVISIDGFELSASCGTNGTYEIHGVPAGDYQLQYYSKIYSAEGGVVSISEGTTLSVDMAAVERPLFEPLRRFGFGSLDTGFMFYDQARAANVTSWAWDFDSDGVVDSTEANPSWHYDDVGTNTVTLTIVESGVETVSVYRNCTIVEEVIDTVYNDNAFVFGENAGDLSIVSVSDEKLILSGVPPKSLLPGVVLAGAFGDVGFIRRIVDVSGDVEEWNITTEEAGLEDVFYSVGFSDFVPLEMEEKPNRRLLSASESSSSGSGKKDKRFHFFIDSGLGIDIVLEPSLYGEFSFKRQEGHTYIRAAVAGSLDWKAAIEAHVDAGARYELNRDMEGPNFPVMTIGPVPVMTIAPEFTYGVFGEISGKLHGNVEFSLHNPYMYGFEMDGDDFRWLEPVDSSSEGDVTAEFEGHGTVGVKIGGGVKLRGFHVFSAELGPEFIVAASYSEGTDSPAVFDTSLKVGIGASLNFIDIDIGFFQSKHGFSFFGGAEYKVFSYTGVNPYFILYPSYGEAPLSVYMRDASDEETKTFLGHRTTYPVESYKWSGVGVEGATTREVEHTYGKEGSYPITLEVKGKHLNGVLSRKNTQYVQVGKKEPPPPPKDDPDDEKSDAPKQSCDPNEVNGPMGIGETRLVKPGEWMDYTIYFENIAGLDIADAQEVRVTNPLDKWLDWSTFEMRDVGFNNQIDIGLYGVANGSSEVQMNGTNRNVRTEVGVDMATGVVSWYMRVVDPNGMFGWPADGGGFLPSNDETHRGEGHLTYRIKVRDDAPGNVVITNSATIVFDYNDPIETDPAWWNTVAELATVKMTIGGFETTMDLIVGQPYGELPVPAARSGYTFGGWWTAPGGPNGGGARVRSGDAVTSGDHELYECWLTNAYEVKFEKSQPLEGYENVEGVMSNQAFEFDKAAALDACAYTLEGHTFGGWTTNGAAGAVYADCQVVSNLTDVSGAVVSLYATWSVNSYAVTFDADGGVGGWARDMEYGAEIEVPTVTRDGYSFAGWEPATGQRPVVPASNVTYVAQWTVNEYTVAFDANGGVGGWVRDMECGANIVPPVVTRDGYSFAGWQPGVPASVPASNVTFVAQWTPNKYTVTFDANGGVGGWVREMDFGAVLNVPVVTRDGYAFAGWSSAPLGTVPAEDVTFVAQWEKIVEYATVTITVDGVETQLVLAVGQPYGELPEPMARGGYVFGGWYTGPDGTGKRVNAQTIVDSGDSALYEYWLANAYLVRFNANGGVGVMSSQAYVFDEPQPLDGCGFEREGYAFGGWAVSAVGDVVYGDRDIVVNLADDEGEVVDLYAVWFVNSYMVTFDANGGVGGWAKEMEYGAEIVPPDVSREDHVFARWQPALLAAVPAQDMTFVAQWEEIPKDPERPENPENPGTSENPDVEKVIPRLWPEDATDATSTSIPDVASIYDGCVFGDGGVVKGTLQVKVGKPKRNKKTGATTAKVSATIQMLGEKKATAKGEMDVSDGGVTLTANDGRALALKFSDKRMAGSFGGMTAEGSRNAFVSKDKGEQAAANAALAQWLGPVNVAWTAPDGVNTMGVTIAKKGKVKASGTLADGTKVSGSSQAIRGAEWFAVPVLIAKKAQLAFTLWLPAEGQGDVQVTGLGDDVVAGKPGTLAPGAKFGLDADAFAAMAGDATFKKYLPDGVAVKQEGAKWVVAKAGKVAYLKGTTEVDAAKAGDNPSGLKLTYQAKTGAFKGAFKAYVAENGKVKALSAKIVGVVVKGIGYGMATIKKLGGVWVEIGGE